MAVSPASVSCPAAGCQLGRDRDRSHQITGGDSEVADRSSGWPSGRVDLEASSSGLFLRGLDIEYVWSGRATVVE